MCTLCACYLVDCSNGTKGNTATVILLYRQVTGSAPSNVPLNISAVRSNGPDIAFTARLGKDIQLGQHQPVDFDVVITNQGNAYDARHGEFRAPVNGLYHFSATVMSLPGKPLYCQIVRNGAPLIWLHGIATNNGVGSADVNLVLSAGDMVWVRKDDNAIPYTIHAIWSSFSGHLIMQY